MVLKNIFHIAQHVFKTLINFSKHARENTENCDTDCLCQIEISVPLKLSVSVPRKKRKKKAFSGSVFLANFVIINWIIFFRSHNFQRLSKSKVKAFTQFMVAILSLSIICNISIRLSKCEHCELFSFSQDKRFTANKYPGKDPRENRVGEAYFLIMLYVYAFCRYINSRNVIIIQNSSSFSIQQTKKKNANQV